MDSAEKIFWRITEAVAAGKPIDNTVVEIWETQIETRLAKAVTNGRDDDLTAFLIARMVDTSAISTKRG